MTNPRFQTSPSPGARLPFPGQNPTGPLAASGRRSARTTSGAAGLALVGILLAVVAYKFLQSGKPGGPVSGDGSTDPADVAAIPETRFTDITAASGVRFVHENGAFGDKLLPETMGGGVAFFDFDKDGDPDLLLINSSHWPGHLPPGATLPTHALYRNDGQGHFTDVTAGSGLDVSSYGMGVACGDYDNDGRGDVFITGVGGNRLFHNAGHGKFQEVTAAAGVGGTPDGWSTSAAWLDYDNDGKLDLFVCNYVQWSARLDLEVNYTLPGIGRAYGPPMNFPGSFPCLYHNEGNGRFTDVSALSGVQIKKPGSELPAAKSLGVAPVDLDGDGWIDLIVANDTVQNFVFHNERNGKFKEVGALAGLAYGPFGGTRGAMGIDSGRFQDGDSLAVAIGNFANEMTALYVSSGSPMLFTDDAINQGIGHASRRLLTFGVFFFDYDLDGWMDLLTVNGHIENQISRAQPGQTYAQPAQLFWNSGGRRTRGGFVNVPPERCGPDLLKPIVGRGSAYADIDGDGDLDVVFTQAGGPAVLLRNDQNLNRHWIRLALEGTGANRDAIGAWIKVRAGGRTFSRQIMPTRGYLSQSELPVTIGLGSATSVESVEIKWPGGKTQMLDRVPTEKVSVVRE